MPTTIVQHPPARVFALERKHKPLNPHFNSAPKSTDGQVEVLGPEAPTPLRLTAQAPIVAPAPPPPLMTAAPPVVNPLLSKWVYIGGLGLVVALVAYWFMRKD